MGLVADARGAWWAARSIRQARGIRNLSNTFQDALPRVPTLPASAERGVNLSLRAARATCLVRAIVMQAWLLSQGEERDLVIGVTAPSTGFAAHAWLEGDPPCHEEGFRELTRRSAR